MRYYSFVLNTTIEEIEKNTKIKLRNYSYQDTLAAVNNYMYQNIKNNFTFLIYNAEESFFSAVFSYDERKYSFKEAWNYIMGMLEENFLIKRIKKDPYEITIAQFVECLDEGKRRENGSHATGLIESANLWFYYNYFEGMKNRLDTNWFEFEEWIIQETYEKKNVICDSGFLHELENIASHKNMFGYQGNIVHYVISGRSSEAINSMTEILLDNLFKAGRISGRRVEVIREVDPDIYLKANHIQSIFENSYGGVVIIDLSEKFGKDPVDYTRTCEYLEKLVKKYRNQCLFLFTYNMNKPGFSYQLLPKLKKYILPVMLREGTGDRRAAVRYMKSLIENSEYAAYAGQAKEYMKQFSGNVFSQTDVLMAYEQFEAWCVNKNMLQAYAYDTSDNFLLDRDENTESAENQLKKMIGLNRVKEQINRILTADVVEKERRRRIGSSYQSSSMHMVFGGNSGTAKTTVAKLFARIAKEKGVLKSGAFVEKGGLDLDGIGAATNIREAFLAAQGGVLFVDEAYSLKSDSAITVFLQELENQREHVIVILAGYNERMREFMERNEGLKSRIPHWVEFPDYMMDELTAIFQKMVQERGFRVTEDAVKEAQHVFEKARRIDDFGNGRYVRNLLEQAIQQQSVRLMADRDDVSGLGKRELFLIRKEDIGTLDEKLNIERPVGEAQKELDEMIGLSSVKEVIHKAIANYKFSRIRMELGMPVENASLHMVFTGNPGTAKTTVARLFAQILKDENVLPTGTFVETGRGDLIGEYAGATAPLIKKKFKEAQGGVLFIDEAYALCDGYANGYGDEAINTIVQEMENHREDVIVIFAGYPAPMKQFLDRNPGMRSRIAFQIPFEDYSTEELCAITELMVSRKKMMITDTAMEKLRTIYKKVRNNSDYGNGRFVRKMIEEAEMNMALRVLPAGNKEVSIRLLTTLEADDIPEVPVKETIPERKIGFSIAS